MGQGSPLPPGKSQVEELYEQCLVIIGPHAKCHSNGVSLMGR